MVRLAPQAGPAVAPGWAQALRAAWQRSPAGRTAQAHGAAAQAREDAAAAWLAEPPALTVSERSDRWQADRGRREWEAEIELPLRRPALRQAGQRAAHAQSEAEAAARRAAALALAGQLREAAWALRLAEVDAEAGERRLQDARALAADVSRRVRAGDLARLDGHRADAALARAEADAARARVEQQRARLRYAALTGQPQPPRQAEPWPLPGPLLEPIAAPLSAAAADRAGAGPAQGAAHRPAHGPTHGPADGSADGSADGRAHGLGAHATAAASAARAADAGDDHEGAGLGDGRTEGNLRTPSKRRSAAAATPGPKADAGRDPSAPTTTPGTLLGSAADTGPGTAADTAPGTPFDLPSDAEDAAQDAEDRPEPPWLQRHPAYATARRAEQQARAELARADADRADAPSLIVGLTRERDRADDAVATTTRIGVRWPLGTAARNQPRLTAARAAWLQAQAESQVAARELQAEVRAAVAEARQAAAVQALAEREAALAAEARRLVARAFELGEADLPTRLRAEGEHHQARLAARRAQHEAGRAVSRLRQALGLLPGEPDDSAAGDATPASDRFDIAPTQEATR